MNILSLVLVIIALGFYMFAIFAASSPIIKRRKLHTIVSSVLFIIFFIAAFIFAFAFDKNNNASLIFCECCGQVLN